MEKLEKFKRLKVQAVHISMYCEGQDYMQNPALSKRRNYVGNGDISVRSEGQDYRAFSNLRKKFPGRNRHACQEIVPRMR